MSENFTNFNFNNKDQENLDLLVDFFETLIEIDRELKLKQSNNINNDLSN